MKRFAGVTMVCLSILVPSNARADDGGWLDWLYRMDAKFVGVSTEIHAWCGDKQANRVRCEEWYGLHPLFGPEGKIKGNTPFEDIRHEVNIRFSYYRTYGDLYPAPPGSTDLAGKTSNAIKVMGFYDYSVSPRFVIGAGAGVMPFYGGDMASSQWSGIVTGAVTWAFAPPLKSRWSPFFVRVEESYITHAIVPGLFTTPASGTASGEWNFSVGVGVDFRRR